jgi:hypothetical protein
MPFLITQKADSCKGPAGWLCVLLLLQEPLAFLGGVFAGVLGLNLEEEPLKGWVERTQEQAGTAPPAKNRPRSQQLDKLLADDTDLLDAEDED